MCQEIEEIKILKQKLLDIFYLVDDSEDMHGITDCNNQFKECWNVASFYCENYMCKMCCQVCLVNFRKQLIKNSV